MALEGRAGHNAKHHAPAVVVDDYAWLDPWTAFRGRAEQYVWLRYGFRARSHQIRELQKGLAQRTKLTS